MSQAVCLLYVVLVFREFQRSPEWDVKLGTFLNENFVPDSPLLKMLKPLPADFNFGAAFVEYTDTLIGEIILYSLYNISYIIWAISCASPDGLDGVYV